jgi:hypothetical protein
LFADLSRTATEGSFQDVVELMLKDERINPAADDNFAFKVACDRGIVYSLIPRDMFLFFCFVFFFAFFL